MINNSTANLANRILNKTKGLSVKMLNGEGIEFESCEFNKEQEKAISIITKLVKTGGLFFIKGRFV